MSRAGARSVSGWVFAPRVLAAAAAVTLVGCASLVTPPLGGPTAPDVSSLEPAVQRDSSDLDAVTRLAAGYVAEGRIEESRSLLASTLDVAPGDEGILVMLGLVEEELGELDAATSRYASYLTRSTGPFRAMVAARWERVRGPGLRAALASRLAEAAASPPEELDAERLAVLPFVSGESARDVAEGLSWLMARELDAGYEVVDRALTLAILDAGGFGVARATELAAAELVMRLSGAGRVVQGTLREGASNGAEVRWDLTVVTALPSGRYDIATVPLEGTGDELLGLTDQGATALIQAAERGRVEDPESAGEIRSPQSLNALAAFARGLRAVAEDDWRGSLAAFAEAVDLDPDFSDGRAFRQLAAAVVRELDAPLAETFETVARASELQRSVVSVRLGASSAVRDALTRAANEPRAEASEALGLDRIGVDAPLLLILDTGGGGP